MRSAMNRMLSNLRTGGDCGRGWPMPQLHRVSLESTLRRTRRRRSRKLPAHERHFDGTHNHAQLASEGRAALTDVNEAADHVGNSD